jgi:hypothetical protein
VIFDDAALARADAVAERAIDDLIARQGSEAAVVVKAPAGAGKSYFVGTAVGKLRQRDASVAVSAPTNEQVFSLVRMLADRYPAEAITPILRSGLELPGWARAANVNQVAAAQAHGAHIVVATMNKLADAHGRGDLDTFDTLLIDEGFQADARRYYGVGAIASTHLLVGDSGQLDPFSTMDHPDRWRGLAEDPLQTAVGVLLRNHPSTVTHHFPISRRLDGRAVPVGRAFYPGHPFSAAVLDGVRELRLLPALSATRSQRVVDAALEWAASTGWAYIELPDAAVLSADPQTIETIVRLTQRLLERAPKTRAEDHVEFRPLRAGEIAVGVSHNDQKDFLRSALDAAGLQDVVVDTANRLQGLQFEVVIAWHPLAGLPEPDGFHLDPGRLCVLLTRHRHACIVVGRASDRLLVDALPPATPAYLGWDPDPVLDGWAAHQAVFNALDEHRLPAA